MRQLNDISENRIINDLIKTFARSPLQQNAAHESDAEIITLDKSPFDLAVTIDTISEEIKTGLYSDPYQIGWICVMINMSDLAAAGAVPLGILISQILPAGITETFTDRLQSGINDACRKCGTFVLGGDTNWGDNLTISGCAIGTVGKDRHIKRTGCEAGDKIFITGKAGIGNAYAAKKLLFKNSGTSLRKGPGTAGLNKDKRFSIPAGVTGEKNAESSDVRYKTNNNIDFYPAAKLEWCNLLNKYSSGCIDTSDGVLSSLDQLMRLNNVGFRLRPDWNQSLNDQSKILFNNFNLPLWLLLAGEHGEYELLFSVPPGKEPDFLNEAAESDLNPLFLAEATPELEIVIDLYSRERKLDTGQIRNLAFEKDFSPSGYLNKLLEIDTLLH